MNLRNPRITLRNSRKKSILGNCRRLRGRESSRSWRENAGIGGEDQGKTGLEVGRDSGFHRVAMVGGLPARFASESSFGAKCFAMSSWLDSLETVMRLQHFAIWFAIVAAVAAAASGALSHYLSGVEARLREGAFRDKIMASRTELEKESKTSRLELDDLRRQLDESEARASGFLDKIETLERKLADGPAKKLAANVAKPPPADTPAPVKPAPSPFLSSGQSSQLRSALQGQPAGEATLVSVSGDQRSLAFAQELESALNQAGWTASVIQAVFTTPPEELVFVVHSRDDLPPRQIALARALSDAGLIHLPAKVLINPSRPAGYLGLLVAAPR